MWWIGFVPHHEGMEAEKGDLANKAVIKALNQRR
jgi:hypothetical protein